jgi:SAM-dependent methyltransferase
VKGPETPAGRRAIEVFATAPRGDRFHVRARWWSCPFPEIQFRVPVVGRILEVGCGHGLLSLYLALSAPGRVVEGVDIDEHKIVLAQAAAARLRPGEAQVSFAAIEPGTLPDGLFDAIVINDVLYLMPEAVRRDVLAACVERLNPDGVLVVKEIDDHPRWKYEVNHLQELVATKVLRYTEGDLVEVVPMQHFADQLEDLGLATTIEPIDRWYPHAHAILTARRPDHVAAE